MDAVFEKFIEKAKRLGLCQEYTDKVDKAGSKKAFMDIAIDINSMPWLCDCICHWHGLTPEYICESFPQFLNGRYTRDKDGYTSQIYCQPEVKEITVETTAILIIGYNGILTIPQNRICEIYLCKSNVEIAGEGRGLAYCYDSTISNQDSAPVIIKENKRYGD